MSARTTATRARDGLVVARQRWRVLDVLLRLMGKMKADRGTDLAAVIAYWSFFSIFPVLLVLVTILDLALQGRPDLQEDILDSFLANIPVIGNDLAAGVDGLSGSPVTVAVGVLAGLWAGTKAVEALQRSMEVVWEVPVLERRTFVVRKLWAVVLLGVLGVGLLGATAVASIATILADLELVGRLASIGGSIVVNTGVLLVLFRLTSPRGLTARLLWPGALLGGGLWFLLQYLGAYFTQRFVAGASDTYGSFALVIGLLTWFHLQSRVVVIAAELDAVLSGHDGTAVDPLTPR